MDPDSAFLDPKLSAIYIFIYNKGIRNTLHCVQAGFDEYRRALSMVSQEVYSGSAGVY